MDSESRNKALKALEVWDNLPAFSPAALADGRKDRAEQELIAAMRAAEVKVPSRPFSIYRGITVWDDALAEAILAGETVTIPGRVLSSWSRKRSIAKSIASEYASMGNGIVIKMRSSDLQLLVDVGSFYKAMSSEEKSRHNLRISALIEQEVVAVNPEGGLQISSAAIDWMAPGFCKEIGSITAAYRRRHDQEILDSADESSHNFLKPDR